MTGSPDGDWLDELERLALNAHRGPWKFNPGRGTRYGKAGYQPRVEAAPEVDRWGEVAVRDVIMGYGQTTIAEAGRTKCTGTADDLRFIAAADPTTVLALVVLAREALADR